MSNRIAPRAPRLPMLVAGLFALTGCFGEGDGKPRILGTPPPPLIGQLINSPVSGAAWQNTSGGSGTTNAQGEFEYADGDTVTFFVGGIELGSALGAPIITPVELTSSSAPTDRPAANQLRFLQSIDDDADPSNGIVISSSTQSLAAGRSLDFSAADFDAQLIATVQAITEPDAVVVSEGAALGNFYSTYAARGGSDTFGFLFPGFPPVGGGIAYELVFADEFNEGTQPSPEFWNYETGYGQNGWGNNEWQLYTDSSDNVRVEDGNLVIQARCDTPPCGKRDGSVTSARITTQDKFEFKFGKVIARIKPPVGKAAWPAFWALGANFPEIGWPFSGEIDFMEVHNAFSNERTAHFTIHWCEDSIQAPAPCTFPEGWVFDSQSFEFNESLGDDFHIFEADWDRNRIVGKVDGVTIFERDINAATMDEFLKEFFLILNVAMGGTLGSNNQDPDGTEVWPQTMLVDYVRVFQAIDSGGGDGFSIDFEDAPGSYDFGVDGGFEGGVTTVVANPDPSGINESAQVAQMQKFMGADFAGSKLTLPAPLEISAGSVFAMKVWASRPVPVLFKLEGPNGDVEVTANHSGNGWELLNFDFGAAAGTFDAITFIFDLGQIGMAGTDPDNWTFYFDDIELLADDVDVTPPSLTAVSIASDNADPALAKVGDTVTVSFSADEAIQPPVVTIGGTAADTVTGSGGSWQASRVLVEGDTEGDIGFTIDFADAEDNAGETATATTDGTAVTLDKTEPTVTISGAPASFQSLAAIALSFEFSEPVIGFALADIAVTSGAASALASVNATTYTANVTPNGTGDLVVTVAADAFSDAAGNANVDAATVTVVNDLVAGAPLLSTISIASSNVNAAFAREGDVVTITMVANEEIVAPTVTIAGAAAQNVDGGGASWTASRAITASDPPGEVAFVIDFQDLDGVDGPQSTVTTDESAVVIDLSGPMLTIEGLPGSFGSLDPLPVTFQFDEDVTGFDAGDVAVTNAAIGAFAEVNAATYTATVTPDGNGDVLITVAAAAAADPAGNLSAEASATILQPFWQLVWSDEFDGAALDPNVWTKRSSADCPAPCPGQQIYASGRVSVAGGVLEMEAISTPGPTYVSGFVDTLGNREFTYGRIEIDAQMPATLGAAPSLFLLPANDSYGGPWPVSGQIDIVNAPDLGVGGNQDLEHATHYGLPAPEDSLSAAAFPAPVAADANVLTYALEWEGGEIRWYVDGTHVATQTQDNWYTYAEDADGVFMVGEGAAPFDQDFYLAMGLGVSDSADGTSVFPQSLEIHAVRVYECANAVDPLLGTGCATVDAGAVPLAGSAAPFTDMFDVYINGPAVVSLGGVDNALVPGTTGTMTMSDPLFQDGAETIWRVTVDALSGSGSVFMASDDFLSVPEVDAGIDLTGSGTAGELIFDLRVTASTPGSELYARLASTAGNAGEVILPLPADDAWQTVSVKFADLLANPVSGGDGLDLGRVINLFELGVRNGVVSFDVDNVRISVACRDAGACDPAPISRDVEYAQDFEGMSVEDPDALANDNWIVGANVFNAAGDFAYNYFAFPAPNGGAAFSALVADQGGPTQGGVQMTVYNDYNNADHGNSFLIEALVFQERPVVADDVGRTFEFSFDVKQGNINNPGDDLCMGIGNPNPPCDSEAFAFIKTLDPGNGFATTKVDQVETTNFGEEWGRLSLSITIDPGQEGQLLQFGFFSNASNFEPSGMVYDNLQVTK